MKLFPLLLCTAALALTLKPLGQARTGESLTLNVSEIGEHQSSIIVYANDKIVCSTDDLKQRTFTCTFSVECQAGTKLHIEVIAFHKEPFHSLESQKLTLTVLNSPSKDWSSRTYPKTVVLFDVDGTLTKPRGKIERPKMTQMLLELKKHVVIGFVGGSDLEKQKEQLGSDCLELFDFAFSQNGLVSFRKGVPYQTMSFLEQLGENNYAELVSFILNYIAHLSLPKKRGNFIELRQAMLNVSPIGRSCSQEEREEFYAFDKIHQIRQKMCHSLEQHFVHLDLRFSIGGQISIDIFPRHWDKTFCLRWINEGEGNWFEKVYFWGDMIVPGGNDWEIGMHPLVLSNATSGPEETFEAIQKMFLANQ